MTLPLMSGVWDVRLSSHFPAGIFAEMITGKVLFPGKDRKSFAVTMLDVNQFSIITELLGSPDLAVIETICSANTYSQQTNYYRAKFVKSLPPRERQNFASKIPGATMEAIDLIEKILVFDPKSRITAAEALNHSYLLGYQVCPLAFLTYNRKKFWLTMCRRKRRYNLLTGVSRKRNFPH